MQISRINMFEWCFFFSRFLFNYSIPKISWKRIILSTFGFKKKRLYWNKILNYIENSFNHSNREIDKKSFNKFKKKKKKSKIFNQLHKFKKIKFETSNLKNLQIWKIYDSRQEDCWSIKKKKIYKF